MLDTECRVDEVLTAPVDPHVVEDLARAEDGTLWLAGIGDNDGRRDTVALHALHALHACTPLHALPADGTAALFRLTYPDGPHDAEALLLDRSGAPFILTKDVLGGSGIYTPVGPLTSDEPTALRRVGSLDLRPTGTAGGPADALGQLLVTGASLSPDGRLAVVRTYTDAYLYAVPDGDLAAALAGLPVRIALPPSPQGEAIAFAANGRDLLLTSEGVPFDVTLLPATSDPAGGAGTASAPAPAGAALAGRSAGAESLLLPVVAVGILGGLIGWGLWGTVTHRRRVE